MKLALPVFLAAVFTVGICEQKHTPPKVQVYSSLPGEYGQKNVLICHVKDFYPPDLRITILKDDVEVKGSNQTDLAFSTNWLFRLTKSVQFTPVKGELYTCKIEHGSNINTFLWEPNM